MYRHYVPFLAVLTCLTVTAQTINLRGVVSNSSNQPVSGAIVSVVGQNWKDTTGADGKYSFTGDVAVSLPAFTPKTNDISMHNGVIQFLLRNSSPVKIEIFDVKGNLLKKEMMPNTSAGVYHFNLSNNQFAQKHLIVKASIGRQEMAFSYMNLGSGTIALKSSDKYATSQSEEKLAKVAAAIIDTLKITATGYATREIPLTTLNQELNVTLFGENDVVVQLDQTRQVIDGFGINNTWMGGWSDAEISDMFDSTSGLGLSILRIGMGPDGNPYNGNGCWDDIKKAKAKGLKYIIGTCWTPPANYKTNNDLNRGGHLKPEFYSQWATTVAAFANKVKQGSGYDLYAMSPQNETDFASCGNEEPCNGDYNTCIFTGKEYAAYLKVVGPKIRAAGCKVIAPEASEWIHVWSDKSGCCSVPGNKPSSDPLKCGCFTGQNTPCASTCTSGGGYNYGNWLHEDAESWNQIDILGTHQYDTQVAEPWPSDIPRSNTQGLIHIWQTEMSGVRYWPEQGPSTTIENGVAVAAWIHNALTVGDASGWCWWWYKPLGDITNEGLYTKSGNNFTKAKRYNTFGNFSRYVRPGMTRVEIAGKAPDNVLLSAFKGAGNKVVIVAVNKGSSSATVTLSVSGGTAPASFTPNVTAANENWASKADVTTSNGKFTATLAGTTVTTFVSK
jgi:glucuronoarabinoxylan endo-1,4-beta-xylanase